MVNEMSTSVCGIQLVACWHIQSKSIKKTNNCCCFYILEIQKVARSPISIILMVSSLIKCKLTNIIKLVTRHKIFSSPIHICAVLTVSLLLLAHIRSECNMKHVVYRFHRINLPRCVSIYTQIVCVIEFYKNLNLQNISLRFSVCLQPSLCYWFGIASAL